MFDAYGVLIAPNGECFSFDLSNPAALRAGVKAIARSVPGLPTGWQGLLYSNASIPAELKGRGYRFIIGLVPAGKAPAVENAIPGYLWQLTVTVR
jgi:hypothetical protein